MPWENLSSKKVYQNNFISVFDEKVSAPNGFKTQYGRVHFHRKAASVLVINKLNKEILLIGQDRYPLNSYSWETIQGGGELEDKSEYIARRELREEAKLDSYKLNFICKTNTSNSVTDEKAFLFWCDKEDTFISENDPQDSTELISRKWFKLDNVLKMIYDQEITDSLTQISIFYILRNLI